MPSQTERDLGEHFSRRLHNLVVDTVDTCRHTDLRHEDTVTLVISSLMYEICIAAVALELTENQFGTMVLAAYRQMLRRVAKLKAQQE